ncbi:hypothetical protein PG985_014650 [Apiospora marii]|uniref:Uncharacterized protein n=1 Tax=Apiospora marii TaxID=335849 RepID=A0ABR1R5A3_9PEZI
MKISQKRPEATRWMRGGKWAANGAGFRKGLQAKRAKGTVPRGEPLYPDTIGRIGRRRSII